MQSWTDEALAWNISEFGNQTQIFIPSSNIWIPDLYVYKGYISLFTIHRLSLQFVSKTDFRTDESDPDALDRVYATVREWTRVVSYLEGNFRPSQRDFHPLKNYVKTHWGADGRRKRRCVTVMTSLKRMDGPSDVDNVPKGERDAHS